MRTLLVFLTLLCTSASFGFADSLNVVATTGMIADIAQEVIGDQAEVQVIIPPGVDPHLYRATRSDMAIFQKADVIFYNGLFLEGKMIDALHRLKQAGKPVYPVTERISKDALLKPQAGAGEYDPHVWMDPLSWSKAVLFIADRMAALDPAQSGLYAKRAAQYKESLMDLHRYASKALAEVESKQRILITAHDAFQYFGRRYEFEVRGIQGISTESEAGLKDIEEIVNILVTRKIPTVFIESTVSDRHVQALIEGAKAQGHAVRIGGELFSDAMGSAGTYEGTYQGMIDHNVTLIARSLGSKIPKAGMRGQLQWSKVQEAR